MVTGHFLGLVITIRKRISQFKCRFFHLVRRIMRAGDHVICTDGYEFNSFAILIIG